MAAPWLNMNPSSTSISTSSTMTNSQQANEAAFGSNQAYSANPNSRRYGMVVQNTTVLAALANLGDVRTAHPQTYARPAAAVEIIEITRSDNYTETATEKYQTKMKKIRMVEAAIAQLLG
jgi:hypothetical protein